MTRGQLWIAVALAVTAGVVWVAARRAAPPPTDEELIRAAFTDAARAASDRKAGEVMKVVSERFRGGGLDRHEAHRVVAGLMLRAAWASVTVAGVEVVVEEDRTRARANVDVVLAGASGEGKGLSELLPDEGSAHRFRCGLEREEEGWRVTAAEWAPISLAQALAGPPRPEETSP